MPRLNRKDEHIMLCLKKKPTRADFSDFTFINNCLPEHDLNEINLNTIIMGRSYRSPLFFNSITGGTALSEKINYELALVAQKLGMPMAVGSQMAAVENNQAANSFEIVRRIYPDGTIWSNIGSYATPAIAGKAIEMINADGIQIHLNAPQELLMNEGNCHFKGVTERIKQVVDSVQVPVIVKEVGFGIAREQAFKLLECGVNAIDVSGRGGTNFAAIESHRAKKKIPYGLAKWGIPTAISLVEVSSAVGTNIEVFASGGVNTAIDIAKSLALGASAVGMAGLPIYILLNRGRNALINRIRRIELELRTVMMMLGIANVHELKHVPLVVSGFSAEWLKHRGIDTSSYSRSGH